MAAAASVVERHQSLRAFLVDVLGLDPDTAEADACRLEHHVSQVVVERLRLLMAYRRDHPARVASWDPRRGDLHHYADEVERFGYRLGPSRKGPAHHSRHGSAPNPSSDPTADPPSARTKGRSARHQLRRWPPCSASRRARSRSSASFSAGVEMK